MSTSTTEPAGDAAGALDILRDAGAAIRSTQLVLVLFVLLAGATLVSQTLANFLGIAVQSVAVLSVYSTIGGRTDASNSLFVRVLLAFVASLIAGIVVIIGLLLLVVPGIYAALRLRLVIPAVVLADAGPLEALGLSADLTSGNVATVFGVWAALTVASLLLVGAVAAATGGVPTAGGSLDPEPFRGVLRLAAAIETVLIAPIGVAANAVMFDAFDA